MSDEAEATVPGSAVPECEAEAVTPTWDDVLLCWLPEGHEGPHHDTADQVMWLETGGRVTWWPEGRVQP